MEENSHTEVPIGSMYGIFIYIWLIFMVNVGISYMDPMGYLFPSDMMALLCFWNPWLHCNISRHKRCGAASELKRFRYDINDIYTNTYIITVYRIYAPVNMYIYMYFFWIESALLLPISTSYQKHLSPSQAPLALFKKSSMTPALPPMALGTLNISTPTSIHQKKPLDPTRNPSA